MARTGDDEGQLKSLALAFVPSSSWSLDGVKLDDVINVTTEGNGLTHIPGEPEGSYPADALATGATVSSTWFQPKKAKAYDGLYRFKPNQKVAYFGSFSPMEGDATQTPQLEKCADIYLAGSSALMTGAAATLATAALF